VAKSPERYWEQASLKDEQIVDTRQRQGIDNWTWLQWSVVTTISIWLLAILLAPIPSSIDAGHEAARRGLAFAAGVITLLLLSCIVQLIVGRWLPRAGLSVAAFAAGLAACANVLQVTCDRLDFPGEQQIASALAQVDMSIRSTSGEVFSRVIGSPPAGANAQGASAAPSAITSVPDRGQQQ
jgi:hypothetical protein